MKWLTNILHKNEKGDSVCVCSGEERYCIPAKDDYIDVYESYFKRYVDMGELDEYLVARTICRMCKEQTRIEHDVLLRSVISEKMNFVVL